MDIWICYSLILLEAPRRKIMCIIHRTVSDRNVMSPQGSLLHGQRSFHYVNTSLWLCLGLQGVLMRGSGIEQVLIQIHMLSLKTRSKLGPYFVNALRAFQIMSQAFVLVSECGCLYIGRLFFSFKTCPLLSLSVWLSDVSCTLADAAQACWVFRDLGLLNGKTHVSGHSHKLMFAPVATYPLGHELMFSSKCSEKKHGSGEVVPAGYVMSGKSYNFSRPQFLHL